MAAVTNVRVSAANVSYNGNDLGHIQGGVTITYAPEYHDVQVDKYGNSVAEKVLIGENLTVECNLAESTVTNYLIGIPASTSAGGGDRATIGRQAGRRMSTDAKQLVIHPIENGATDYSDDVVIHKAIASADMESAFEVDGERLIPVTFQAMIDETKTDGNLLGHIGDSSA